MNAAPLLAEIACALARAKLEAILIGNAGAALHGAPVTTLDFDFLFRKTPANLAKLKVFAKELGVAVFQPFYPVSGLYRAVDDDRGLQVDFLPAMHGVRSFPSLRSRASNVSIGGYPVQVASLEDILRSKEAAVGLETSPCCMSSKRRSPKSRPAGPSRKARLDALRAESERELVDMIRRLLDLPMEKRTHFLRVRLPGGGSCL